MTTSSDAPATTNNTPQGHESPPSGADLVGALEASGKVQFDGGQGAGASAEDMADTELAEMRVISKRLKALPPDVRKRVLTWLVGRFGA